MVPSVHPTKLPTCQKCPSLTRAHRFHPFFRTRTVGDGQRGGSEPKDVHTLTAGALFSALGAHRRFGDRPAPPPLSPAYVRPIPSPAHTSLRVAASQHTWQAGGKGGSSPLLASKASNHSHAARPPPRGKYVYCWAESKSSARPDTRVGPCLTAPHPASAASSCVSSESSDYSSATAPKAGGQSLQDDGLSAWPSSEGKAAGRPAGKDDRIDPGTWAAEKNKGHDMG
jgi:hypothetical protein